MKTHKFNKNDTVTMTNDALENYGEQYRDVPLIITSVATRYMPAKEFYNQGKPEGFHPGYDESVSEQGLYDLQREDGQPLNFSLYDWELQQA